MSCREECSVREKVLERGVVWGSRGGVTDDSRTAQSREEAGTLTGCLVPERARVTCPEGLFRAVVRERGKERGRASEAPECGPETSGL